ncbi:MAG: YafY family transcriptional regulator [bacterium]|nr:YafY family transcriptional regulator [bacterium]
MRADRLITILLELQARGKTTSRKLAGKLEVSERTIHRDMEALSTAGIPVYALRGPDGGWELAEGYRTNLTAMQRTEILALIFATAVSPAGTPEFRRDFEAAITRLLASMPPAYRQDAELVRERIHIDGADWYNQKNDAGLDLLPLLQEAVWSCDRLEILYRGGQAETPRRRTVQPLGLVAKRQTWYLAAATRDGMRSFRISRIQSAKNTGKKFSRPKDFNLAGYWRESVNEFQARRPEYRVRLLLREKKSGDQKYLRGIGPMPIQNQRPSKERPGWLEVEVDFETADWARFFFAGTREEVEVLSPRELRKDLKAIGARLQKRYSS